MQLKKHLLKKLPAFAVVILALGLASCSSYQYVGQNTDGIYGGDQNKTEADVVEADVEQSNDNTYYKNYFKNTAKEMESNGQDDVFVDIDAYEGTYSDETVDVDRVSTGYAGWGENSTEVSINVYNTGFNNYWHRPYYGWSNWGWSRPYYGWNIGFGYGYGYGGFYNPYIYSPYYGYGGHPYYGHYYGNYGYGRNGVAYSGSRRGGVYGRTSVLGRRVQSNAGIRTNTSRVRTTATPRVRANSTAKPRVRSTTPRVRTTTPRVRPSAPRTSTPRTTTPRSSKPRVKSTTPRRSTPRATTPRRSTPRMTTPRSSSPRMSTPRSSGSSSRVRGRG